MDTTAGPALPLGRRRRASHPRLSSPADARRCSCRTSSPRTAGPAERAYRPRTTASGARRLRRVLVVSPPRPRACARTYPLFNSHRADDSSRASHQHATQRRRRCTARRSPTARARPEPSSLPGHLGARFCGCRTSFSRGSGPAERACGTGTTVGARQSSLRCGCCEVSAVCLAVYERALT